MIKFFRHIRQRLLSESKFSKYLLYAIGEIILVVIGIFLALQLNNLNQERKASEKEELLLQELHDEFINNKKQLEEVVQYHVAADDACNKIIAMFPIDLETVDLDSLGKHHYQSSYIWTFNPSQGVINSLVNTSSFELISNDTLRRQIIAWSDVLTDFQDEEVKAVQFVNGSFVDYWDEHLSWNENFKDQRIKKERLTSLQFENLIYHRKDDLNNIIGTDELEKVEGMIDRIIELSEPEKP
jgi:hypothetical protein